MNQDTKDFLTDILTNDLSMSVVRKMALDLLLDDAKDPGVEMMTISHGNGLVKVPTATWERVNRLIRDIKATTPIVPPCSNGNGRLIPAIKMLRAETGMGLKEAKDAVCECPQNWR